VFFCSPAKFTPLFTPPAFSLLLSLEMARMHAHICLLQILLPKEFSERRMSLLPGELVAVDICFIWHPKSVVQSALSSTATVRVRQHAASGCGPCVERLVPQFSEERVAVSHAILSANNREFRRLRNHPLSNEPFAPRARGEGCGGPNSRGHLDRILPSESLARHEQYA